MRILVTGASGFIGSHLCPALTAAGHDVRASMEGSEAVVHLANIAHTAASPRDLQRVNVEGTIAQARAALVAGARRFIYLSSIKAEQPDDVYGHAKMAAEKELLGLTKLELVVLRPPLVYGPRVKANFLALMRAIDRGWPLPLASVENRRSQIYVGNLVDAILRCLENPATGKIFSVSDGTPISTPELCRALGRALGRPARLFHVSPGILELLGGARAMRLTRSLKVDDRAIRQEMEWRPPYTLEEGLRVTADWYRKELGRGG